MTIVYTGEPVIPSAGAFLLTISGSGANVADGANERLKMANHLRHIRLGSDWTAHNVVPGHSWLCLYRGKPRLYYIT